MRKAEVAGMTHEDSLDPFRGFAFEILRAARRNWQSHSYQVPRQTLVVLAGWAVYLGVTFAAYPTFVNGDISFLGIVSVVLMLIAAKWTVDLNTLKDWRKDAEQRFERVEALCERGLYEEVCRTYNSSLGDERALALYTFLKATPTD